MADWHRYRVILYPAARASSDSSMADWHLAIRATVTGTVLGSDSSMADWHMYAYKYISFIFMFRFLYGRLALSATFFMLPSGSCSDSSMADWHFNLISNLLVQFKFRFLYGRLALLVRHVNRPPLICSDSSMADWHLQRLRPKNPGFGVQIPLWPIGTQFNFPQGFFVVSSDSVYDSLIVYHHSH